MTISFRQALPQDSLFIAHAILAALHVRDMEDEILYVEDLKPLVRAIQEENILYSYMNTRVAEVDSVVAGCFVTYDGGIFESLRLPTYRVLGKVLMPGKNLESLDAYAATEPETGAGEYYLDSLAVLPRFRHTGVGRMLVVDAICHGRRQGFHTFTGLVAADSPALLKFYQSEGLMPQRKQLLFGEEYYRLVLER